ncbi:MAG: MOSC N-terminal beta barrel domain-containing protein [Pseudomonadota bacterium]
MSAVISGLFVYPVKSAAGIPCETARLDDCGLRHDREWMIVDASGRGITQRDEKRLALLHIALDAQSLHMGNPQGAGPMIALDHKGQRVSAQVWGTHCDAFDAGDEVSQFLSGWLGRPLRMVRFDPAGRRLSSQEWTAGREVPNFFSDGYPLLVLSTASIKDLAARVGRDLPVNRFRPNVLLDGVAAYAEDEATRLQAGPVRLALSKACIRCIITTIDQLTATSQDDEPIATLKRYRFDPALRGVAFGRNAYALDGVGEILSRGQSVSLE